jgi:hypothetical protein
MSIGGDISLKDNKNISKLDLLFNKLFSLPDAPPPLAEESIVYTFPENLEYYPIQGEINLSIKSQILFLIVYLVIWFALFIILKMYIVAIQGYVDKDYIAYAIGFFAGLIMIFIDTWLLNSYTNVNVLTPSIKPYLSVSPQIIDPDYKEPINDPNKFIDIKAGMGDYKILLDNNFKTKDPYAYNKNNKEHGNIYPAKVYLDKVRNGEILPMNFYDYISGSDINCSYNDEYGFENSKFASSIINNNHCHDPIRLSRFNSGRQKNIYYNSEYINSLVSTAYYLCVIIITWQIYKAHSSDQINIKIIRLGILSLLIILIASLSITNSYDVVSYNTDIFIRTRMLLLGISIGITSLFIE